MKRGVLLFNLGGPETLQAVRPFLYNLFSDPEIIRIKSDILRKTLAWLIAAARHKKSENLYRQIGGGSPLRRITEEQAAALSLRLNAMGFPTRVYIGMRCWNPSIDEAVERILQDGITRLVLLPLFPQYSVTTTGSCLKYFDILKQRFGLKDRMEIFSVDAWFDEPTYVESMADVIWQGLMRFSSKGAEAVHLLYSAHSIPERYVKAGDPFLEQTRKSVNLINEQLDNAFPSTLAFQSKIGPVKWIGPSTKSVLEEMGRKRIGKVLTVPISFISDHIETLQEIGIAYRDLALHSGIGEFHRADAPNLHPKFIDALARIACRTGCF
ncbi:MAG: ferrochelatase [Acidobacteria bacterium]|nr:ferrochelatase [Acidobacteriota bacterium]